MRIFVAGATGALGQQLVPQLVRAGHEVTGMTRSRGKTDLVRSLGARPAVADALDADAVARAVRESDAQVVVHQLTALSEGFDLRRFERTFALTNRLRIEGTDHLLAAARAVGAERFVAQSYAGWPAARTGGPVTTEEHPFDRDLPKAMRSALAGVEHVERVVPAIDWGVGIVLRYGGFYGPGTSLRDDPQAEMVAPLRKRRIPLVGDGGGVWSFVHVEDAAAATVRAVAHGAPGVYNVVDDDPAPVRDWLPVLAAALGAPPPRRVPRFIGRVLAGAPLTMMMTEVRGASNLKAKQELGWQPRHASWRQGFAQGLR